MEMIPAESSTTTSAASRSWCSGIAWFALGLTAIALLLWGCSDDHSPLPVEPASPAPTATTPTGTMRVLEYACDQRDIAAYRTLFTDDFTFWFTPLEADDHPPLSRVSELASAQHLFRDGSPYEPAARQIDLELGTVTLQRDDRPGRTYPYHQQLQVAYHLRAELPIELFVIEGKALFFVVRGDSARLPASMSLPADSTHWYIEGWRDLPASGGTAMGATRSAPLETTPTKQHTWGQLKLIYL